MLIEVKGKISAAEFSKVIDVLSTYFKKHHIEDFVEIDIDLKPFHKDIQLPCSLSNDQGKEIRSLEITKLKSGEFKLKELALDNTWMTNTLDTSSPGDLMLRVWPLYVIGLGLLLLYLCWTKGWVF
jgi:hypothetical protein